MKTVTAQFEVEDERELSLLQECLRISFDDFAGRCVELPFRIIDSPAEVQGEPVAWLKCESKVYKNRVFGTKAEAEKAVANDEGSRLIPLGPIVGHSSTTAPQPAPSDSAQAVRVPAELFQRVVARLEKAQIFDLTKELKSAQKPIGGEQPATQTLQDVAANAMTDFEVTRSIIHDCPALRLPQSFAEKLCAVSQIVVLKGSSPEIARFIADACNEKTDRLAPQAMAPTSDAVALLPSDVMDALKRSREWLQGTEAHRAKYVGEILSKYTRAVAQPVACEPLILKGVGKINGDGWKDTTEIGQEVLAWNTELPKPYAAGQFPRIGNAIWSASTSQYDFTPLNLAEARSAIDSLIASARFEFLDEIANLRQQLAAAQQQSAAASLYVEVGYQYLVRDGFGHQFWHDKDFYNGSRATASRKIFALASTDAATNAGEAGSHE